MSGRFPTNSNPRYRNPVLGLFTAVGLGLLLGLLVLGLFFLNQGGLGLPRQEYIREEVYAFPGLKIERAHLSVEVSSGYLVPTYRQGDVVGAVILAPGTYTFQPPTGQAGSLLRVAGKKVLNDKVASIYVAGNYQEIETLKDQARAKRTGNPYAVKQARETLQESRRYSPLKFFGVPRFFPAPRTVFWIELHGSKYTVQYSEGSQVRLSLPDMKQELVFPAPPGENLQAGWRDWFSLFAFLGLLFTLAVLLLTLIYILTVDLEGENPSGHTTWKDRLVLAGLFLAYMAGKSLVSTYLPSQPTFLIAPDLAVLAAVGVFTFKRGYIRTFFNLRPRNLFRSLLVAVIIAVLAVSGESHALPQALRAHDPMVLVEAAAWSLLAAGFLKALVYHGYLQNTLQTTLPSRLALVATAVLAGGAFLAPGLAAGGPAANPQVLIQALIAVPGTVLVSGYLFQRTGNIYAPAALLGLMDFLPQVLIF